MNFNSNTSYSSNQPYPGNPPPYPGNDPYSKGVSAPFPNQDIGFVSPFSPGPLPPYNTALSDSNSTEEGRSNFASAQFSSKSVRSRFVARVYMILSLQLCFTFIVAGIFCLNDQVKHWVARNQWVSYVSVVVYLVSYFALVCCQRVRRGFPMNIICLSVFTMAFSFMVGTITAFSDSNAVLMAVGITLLIVVTVSFLAACTPIDFTKCYFLLAVLGIVFFFMGIGMMIAQFAFPGKIKILHLVYCCIGVMLFSLYLAFNTQQILGGKHIEMSEEDYIDGALQLYVDIMQIFIYVLQIVQSARND